MPKLPMAPLKRTLWLRRIVYATLLLTSCLLLSKSLSPLAPNSFRSTLRDVHGSPGLLHKDLSGNSAEMSSPASVSSERFMEYEAMETKDIALILKTGYEVYAERLPSQLETFASARYGISPNNTIIVSDFEKTIEFTDWHVHDVIAGFPWTETLKETEKYRIYQAQLVNISSNVPVPEVIAPPGTNNEGWRLDAMKFIPGYKLAAETFPDAKWTVGVDDDTYVIWDNLLAFLSMLEHTKPLYIGAPCMMPPSEIVFAHGGSVVVTSQAAMRQRFIEKTEGLRRWQEESLKWCCGDGVLAMSFSELGINVTGDFRQFFNGEPSENLRVTKDNICQPVLGIHHANRTSMHKLDAMLSELRKVRRGRRDEHASINWGDLLLMFAIDMHKSPESLEMRADWDFLNMKDNWDKNMIEWSGEKSPAVCRSKCDENSAVCLGWLFVKEKEECWFARRVVPGQAAAGLTSGLNMRRIKELQNSSECTGQEWRQQVKMFQPT